MSHLFKLAWIARAFLYKLFFKNFMMPGYMGPPLFILGSSRISVGRRVRIFPGLRAECHDRGRVIIHDDVAIGQCFHIASFGDINIGSGTLISGFVLVTDVDHEYGAVGTPVSKQPMIWKKTGIGKNCFIGMGARIQAGTVLGNGCIVGANAVVRGTFPDYSVIVGSPGRVVKRYNKVSGIWERCE